MTAEQFNAREQAAGRLTQAMLDYCAAHGGVAAVQEACGVDADGKAGDDTQRALRAVLAGRAPIPAHQKGIDLIYGKLPYIEGEGGRIIITKTWVAKNIVSVKLHTGKTVRLHRLVATEFAELFQRACTVSGYTPDSVQTFVPRHTLWNPAASVSLHSWGIAIDFSPSENRMGGTDGHGAPSMLRQHQAFVQVFRDAGWRWGGDWKMKDDMHVQRA
jgi:hypothetical protein